MRSASSGFTLLELLVVGAVALLAGSLALPTGARLRELSKRSVCAMNLKGIGASQKIYAASNDGSWAIPGFSRFVVNYSGVDYLAAEVEGQPIPTNDGEIGKDRQFQSTTEPASGLGQGSTAVSVTRAYWMLVRSGDISVQQFICPSTSDIEDPTENINLYYDFQRIRNISYGYQVPFGPRDTQPREGADNRQVFAADRGPYYFQGNPPDFMSGGPTGGPITFNDSPKDWRAFNSANHGGPANGDGQNVLYADGHANFVRTPAVGIDNDNIYTLMTDEWSAVVPPCKNRIHGDSPHISAAQNPYPGQNAFGAAPSQYSSTDSLIYP